MRSPGSWEERRCRRRWLTFLSGREQGMEEQATPASEQEVPGYAEAENQTIPYGCGAFCSRHSRPVHRAD
ncbi:MAG: hypothetical protein WBJ93_03315, partial [Candidatus Methanoculleus thermohydrogenotrophicum]